MHVHLGSVQSNRRAADTGSGLTVVTGDEQRQRPRADDEAMIFKGVRDGKPYPDHGLSLRDWSKIPPRQVRLDEIVTTPRFSSSTGCCPRTRRSTATCSRTRSSGTGCSTSRTACTGRCARHCETASCCTPASSTTTRCPASSRPERSTAERQRSTVRTTASARSRPRSVSTRWSAFGRSSPSATTARRRWRFVGVEPASGSPDRSRGGEHHALHVPLPVGQQLAVLPRAASPSARLVRVARRVLDVPPAHPADVAVRAGPGAPPVAAGPVAQVVPAAGRRASTAQFDTSYQCRPAAASRASMTLVPLGEDVVVGRGQFAAADLARQRGAVLDDQRVRRDVVDAGGEHRLERGVEVGVASRPGCRRSGRG